MAGQPPPLSAPSSPTALPTLRLSACSTEVSHLLTPRLCFPHSTNSKMSDKSACRPIPDSSSSDGDKVLGLACRLEPSRPMPVGGGAESGGLTAARGSLDRTCLTFARGMSHTLSLREPLVHALGFGFRASDRTWGFSAALAWWIWSWAALARRSCVFSRLPWMRRARLVSWWPRVAKGQVLPQPGVCFGGESVR